eukprot:g79715.t1
MLAIRKKRKTRHDSPVESQYASPPSSPPCWPTDAQSLDEDDPAPAPSSLASFHRHVNYNKPHAVTLCESWLSLHEELKAVREGRFARQGSSDVFEVARDRVNGLVTITHLRENIPGLEVVKKQAREDVAHEIAKRKADMEGPEKEKAVLEAQMKSSHPDDAEMLGTKLINLVVMLGKHEKVVQELESMREKKVIVDVKRVITKCRIFKDENVCVKNETRIVPTRQSAIYVLGGSVQLEGNAEKTLCSVERYDPLSNRWDRVRTCWLSLIIHSLIYLLL